MKSEAGTTESRVCLPAAFAPFYDQAAPDVFRYLARALLGDRAAAEDLTQETFAATRSLHATNSLLSRARRALAASVTESPS